MSFKQIVRPRILEHFSACDDPRKHRIQHQLIDVIVIVVLGTLCGEEGWEGFCEWAEDKIAYLRRFLPLEGGIPSPDTIRRVMERLNPDQFLQAFVCWAEEVQIRSAGQICIDGKTLRGARNPLHIVSAWCEENRIVLGTVKKDQKGNEISAIEELLDLLSLQKGDVVTIDAIGCQKEIVSKIHAQGADYVIALKKNQFYLWSEAENYFQQAVNDPISACSEGVGSKRQDHGREDSQEVWVTDQLDWLPQKADWEGLGCLIMVSRRWIEKGKEHRESRYYISSLRANAAQLGAIIRRHWSIENELHWHLDLTFREDDSQIGMANYNLRHARTMALHFLRSNTSCKRGLKAKMRKCHRSDNYLNEVLIAGNF